LFDHILPLFTGETGIEIRVVAQGTGQALETGRRGDADVVFVHARATEEAFVAAGHGVSRADVMYNDFVIVGPVDDPAGVSGASNAAGALALIAKTRSKFASRGDDSGTHKAELGLWKTAGIEPAGIWYLETGSGMGATLNIAAEMPAYTLADRGSWISFQNRDGLAIQFEGDPRLFNPYGVILVNPEKYPHVKAEAGQTFIDWLVSKTGQAAVGAYMIDGQQLFFPNAASKK
jgi:tungstate transport system substrate-binding protein